MSLSKYLYLSLILILAIAYPALAQEVKKIPLEQTNVVEAKNIPSDTIATDIPVTKQMELLESTNTINDNSLPIVEVGNKKAYDLKDMQAAAEYDILWMKELYKSGSLYDEMYREVANLEIDAIVDNTINTDTLKMRLERLNQKTPFNIAYNPSLENVIKSFLVRKRGLMERMLTASQFYFPLFEEHLDNYNIPLEMKYLAIVESALNPRARSRVGAKGL